jgi:hypothetical protein
MVQCASCPNLTRATRYCSFYRATLAVNEIHREVACEGHPYSRKRKVEAVQK